MPFSENIINIFCLKQRSRNTLWTQRISKLSADSRIKEKMIEGVFLNYSENAILDCADRRKIILDHLSAESAQITRRAALRRSSRRVLSHHYWTLSLGVPWLLLNPPQYEIGIYARHFHLLLLVQQMNRGSVYQNAKSGICGKVYVLLYSAFWHTPKTNPYRFLKSGLEAPPHSTLGGEGAQHSPSAQHKRSKNLITST